MEELKKIHFFDALPSGLKTAEQVAEQAGLSVERLKELAGAYLCPHYRIDGGEPLFQSAEIRKWIAKTLLQRFDGESSLEIKIVSPAPLAVDLPPDALKHIKNLRQLQPDIEPGIYFLCDEGDVVYVGQSKSPNVRVLTHKKDKKFTHVFFIPCPESELDILESKFIYSLMPRLNGNHKTGCKCAPLSKCDPMLSSDSGHL